MATETTTEQSVDVKVKAAVAVAATFYDLIKSTGERGIPSGHLYAMVQHKMDMEQYTAIINLLKRLNLITETNYLLRATKEGAK